MALTDTAVRHAKLLPGVAKGGSKHGNNPRVIWSQHRGKGCSSSAGNPKSEVQRIGLGKSRAESDATHRRPNHLRFTKTPEVDAGGA